MLGIRPVHARQVLCYRIMGSPWTDSIHFHLPSIIPWTILTPPKLDQSPDAHPRLILFSKVHVNTPPPLTSNSEECRIVIPKPQVILSWNFLSRSSVRETKPFLIEDLFLQYCRFLQLIVSKRCTGQPLHLPVTPESFVSWIPVQVSETSGYQN